MTLQSFIHEWNHRYIDFDHAYGCQCVDLVQQYNKELFNGPFLSGQGAADIWNTYPTNLYERIDNQPDNFPLPGDIIIWNKNIGNGNGHIAIVVLADINSLTTFDQNWIPGSFCQLWQHDYLNVLGWLRHKQ